MYSIRTFTEKNIVFYYIYFLTKIVSFEFVGVEYFIFLDIFVCISRPRIKYDYQNDYIINFI